MVEVVEKEFTIQGLLSDKPLFQGCLSQPWNSGLSGNRKTYSRLTFLTENDSELFPMKQVDLTYGIYIIQHIN